MSLTFKLLSLVVRTAAKPIGNYIKRQAHEHEGFRRFAIAQAQRVHRIDMRMRLGLLHDAEAQARMHEKELKAADERKRKAEAPTVRTEEDQKKHDEQKAREEKARDEKADKEGKKAEERQKRVRIRPLSDARAIELGANFFSETFIFLVAVGLLLAENYRSSRKSSQRRDEVADRLDSLEAQVERLQKEHNLPELEALNERLKKAREQRNKPSWYNPAGWWRRTDPDLPDDDDDEGVPGEVEGTGSKRIPGNVPGPSPEQAMKPSAGKEAKDTITVKQGQDEKVTGAAVPPQRVDSVKASQKER